ncbi:hypothetical protein Tco_0292919 [Tanacetum coccineum]
MWGYELTLSSDNPDIADKASRKRSNATKIIIGRIIIPGRVLVTPGSIVVTTGSVVVTPGSVVVTPGSVVVTTGSVLVTPGSSCYYW